MTINRLLMTLIAVAGLGFAVMSQDANAAASAQFIGTWKLDLSKAPAGGPKSITLVTVDAGGGKWKTTVDTVAADDKKTQTVETYAIDGTDSPVTGDPNVDTDAFVSPEPNTLVITSKKAGKVVSTITTKLSADGKTMTAVVAGTGPDGKPTTTTDVWVRQ